MEKPKSSAITRSSSPSPSRSPAATSHPAGDEEFPCPGRLVVVLSTIRDSKRKALGSVSDCWNSSVTVTGTRLPTEGDVVTRSAVEETRVTGLISRLPKKTRSVARKPVPVRVTWVPPVDGPDDGETDARSGGATKVYVPAMVPT